MSRLALTILLALGCNTGPGSEPGGDDGPATPDARDPDAPSATCASLAGTWALSGSCGADLCTVAQVACSLTQVSCNSGARSTSGSVTGTQFSYTGTNGAGMPSTCSGAAAGATATGTCTSSGVSCAFTGNRL